MLACDLICEVRASRSLDYAQVARLEREIAGGFDRQDVEMLLLLDRYAERADPAWAKFLARAMAAAAGVTGPKGPKAMPAAA